MTLAIEKKDRYSATLLVMVNVKKGGGHAPPTLTSQANFALMTECMPESRRYHSVYSVGQPNGATREMIYRGLADSGVS